jgi:hypothetical protein
MAHAPRSSYTADRLKADLEELVRQGPGNAPELLRAVREVLRGWLVHRDGSLRRRATDVMWLFEDWFSPARGNGARDGGQRACEDLVAAIVRFHKDISDYSDLDG